jgi:hypothetical protein
MTLSAACTPGEPERCAALRRRTAVIDLEGEVLDIPPLLEALPTTFAAVSRLPANARGPLGPEAGHAELGAIPTSICRSTGGSPFAQLNAAWTAETIEVNRADPGKEPTLTADCAHATRMV